MENQENQTQVENTEAVAADAPKRGRKPIDKSKPLRERLTDKYNAKVEQYKKLHEEIEEIVAEIEAIDATASIDVGSAVTITVGKGETRREVQGTVLGVRETEEGTREFKVGYGEGFDADVRVVSAGKLRPVLAKAE